MNLGIECKSSERLQEFFEILGDAVAILVHVEPDREKFVESLFQYVEEHYESDFFLYWEASYGKKAGSIAYLLAVHIWNVTPLPSNQYRPSPVVWPKRNEPCLCGSRKKFKLCCDRYRRSLPPLTEIFMLEYVLRHISKRELSNIWTMIPTTFLGSIASSIDANDTTFAERYLLTLDPIFKQDDSCLSGQHADALSALIYLCVITEKPRKRSSLVKRFVQHSDESLRSVALREQCRMLIDQKEFELAQECLSEFMAISEDSLGVIDLRLAMLQAEDKVEEMILEAARAAVLIEKLNNSDDVLSDVMNKLDKRIDSGLSKLIDRVDLTRSTDERLLLLLQGAVDNPPPLLHCVEEIDGCAHIIDQHPLGFDVEKILFDILFDGENPWHRPERWLFIIETHPELTGNLNVLNFFLLALYQADHLAQKSKLVSLAAEISLIQFQRLLPEEPDITFDWRDEAGKKLIDDMFMLARHYYGLEGDNDKAIKLYWWMLRLDSEDRLNVRTLLLETFLLMERYADVIALCDQFRDRMNFYMHYNRAYSLLSLGELPSAEEALCHAVKQFPEVAKAIVQKNYRRPKGLDKETEKGYDHDELSVLEQAWCYRSKYRPIWLKNPAAITWLEEIMKA